MRNIGIAKGLAWIICGATVVACDEQSPTIDASNALEVASCALSVANIHSVIALAGTLDKQSPGLCPDGGVLFRDDSDPNNVSVQADNCLTADANKLQGRFLESTVSRSPVQLAWTFEQLSVSDNNESSTVHGSVVFEEQETADDYFQSLNVPQLQLTQNQFLYRYSATQLSARISVASQDAFVNYTASISQCGANAFDLHVQTTETMHTRPSDTAPNSGALITTAADGSTLALVVAGELLSLALDSNADGVNEHALEVSWRDIDSVTLESRARHTIRPRLRPFVWQAQP